METPDPTLEPPETDPGIDDDTGDAADDVVDEAEAVEVLALSEILPFSQYRISLAEGERPPSDRVQFAMDQALIAACERVARILRSDLPGWRRHKGPGHTMSWVGSDPHRMPRPLFTGRRPPFER